MYGEFFGVTGATSALLDFDSATIVRLSSVMNNSLDVANLRKFKTELLYLQDFLENKVEMEYASPAIRKLSRQISLIKSNAVDSLKRSYKCDIEGMTDQDKEKLILEIEAKIREIARETGSEKSVTNSFRRYDGTGGVISLGEHELKILANYKQNYLRDIKNYSRLIQLTSFKEITVFGEKLHRIASASFGPGFLLSIVERLFSAAGANKEHLRDMCLEGVEILRMHYPTGSLETQQATDGADGFIKTIDFREYLASRMGLNYASLDTDQIPPKVSELGDLFDVESQEFIGILHELLQKNMINMTTAQDLVTLYYKMFRLDYDTEFLCAQLFPEGDKIVLDREELEGIFSRLANVGFYMLSRANSRLMVESLKKISFSSESKTVIDPDYEKGNLTFRRAIDLIETLCQDLSPMTVGADS